MEPGSTSRGRRSSRTWPQGRLDQQLNRHTSAIQSVIARLEGGRARPSTPAFERFVAATGARMRTKIDRRA
jgi:predicted transcriptional regulator